MWLGFVLFSMADNYRLPHYSIANIYYKHGEFGRPQKTLYCYFSCCDGMQQMCMNEWLSHYMQLMKKEYSKAVQVYLQLPNFNTSSRENFSSSNKHGIALYFYLCFIGTGLIYFSQPSSFFPSTMAFRYGNFYCKSNSSGIIRFFPSTKASKGG